MLTSGTRRVRELARPREIDPTSDALSLTSLLMYEVQSRYDDYAADRSVPHNLRMEAMYLMAKGRLDDAQRLMDPRYTRDGFLERIRQSPDFLQFLAEMKAENDRYRAEFGQQSS